MFDMARVLEAELAKLPSAAVSAADAPDDHSLVIFAISELDRLDRFSDRSEHLRRLGVVRVAGHCDLRRLAGQLPTA
jgi:hypothetical protein